VECFDIINTNSDVGNSQLSVGNLQFPALNPNFLTCDTAGPMSNVMYMLGLSLFIHPLFGRS